MPTTSAEARKQPLLCLPGPEHWYNYDGDFCVHSKPIRIVQEGGQVRILLPAVFHSNARMMLPLRLSWTQGRLLLLCYSYAHQYPVCPVASWTGTP